MQQTMKKNNRKSASICAIALVWFCALLHSHEVYTKNNSGEIKTITALELKGILDSDQNTVVVNVLSAESYNNCHIAGSINIPNNELVQKTIDWEKNRKIVVYCASLKCSAGDTAYNKLIQLGFTNVLEYKGGMKEWREMGLETEGSCD